LNVVSSDPFGLNRPSAGSSSTLPAARILPLSWSARALIVPPSLSPTGSTTLPPVPNDGSSEPSGVYRAIAQSLRDESLTRPARTARRARGVDTMAPRARLLECALVRILRVLPLAAPALLILSGTALAQTTPNPTVSPEPIGGWTIWQGWLAIALAVLLVVGVVAAYVRFSPQFYGSQERPKRRQLPPGARTAASLAIPRQGAGRGESRE